jgi:hypothetical protein
VGVSGVGVGAAAGVVVRPLSIVAVVSVDAVSSGAAFCAISSTAKVTICCPHAVLEQLEVLGGQVLDERAGPVADDDVDEYEIDTATKHGLRLR